MQAQAAVSRLRWLQVVTLLVGLSKLSNVTWPCAMCVPAGRTHSNLLILIRISAAGDCEAREIPSAGYRVSTAQLYPMGGRHEE